MDFRANHLIIFGMMEQYPYLQNNLPLKPLDLTLSPSAVLSWACRPQGTVSAADTVTVTSPGGSKA